VPAMNSVAATLNSYCKSTENNTIKNKTHTVKPINI
jgi:hypothetical protein